MSFFSGILLFVIVACVIAAASIVFLVMASPSLRLVVSTALSSLWVKLFGRREEE